MLAAFSKFSDTSPTQRGIFVQTRLLCNTILPPPANVNVDQPPPVTASGCKLDRYDAHRVSPSCASCHDKLDPIGYGLENYDIGGRLRTHDDGHPECTIRETASYRATARSVDRPSWAKNNGDAQTRGQIPVSTCLQWHISTWGTVFCSGTR